MHTHKHTCIHAGTHTFTHSHSVSLLHILSHALPHLRTMCTLAHRFLPKLPCIYTHSYSRTHAHTHTFTHSDKHKHKSKQMEQSLYFTFAFICLQVFLKYYHIEELARLYENLTRKVVLIQSCVRSWLARTRFYKIRWERQKAAVTVQKCASPVVVGRIVHYSYHTQKNKCFL